MAAPTPYILGIDLGSASLGWAAVQLDSMEKPSKLLRSGVRIFDPGVEGTLSDIRQGKEKSKTAARRDARLHRRQLRRRAGRQRDLFMLLQNRGLIPAMPSGRLSSDRHELLDKLDTNLRAKWLPLLRESPAVAAPDQVLPYLLRARALDSKLEPFELGRALYHLAQRRGFQSNRREVKKQDQEELGKVKQGISLLQDEMERSGARTLGEYLSRLDPHLARIRARWTARAMYKHEFKAIWSSQAPHHPDLLTPTLEKQLRQLIFFQRPIASNSHLVGECELEKGRKRAPWACLAAQSFRLLQRVNDLKMIGPSGEARVLDQATRAKLIERLEQSGDIKFTEIKELLGLERRVKFNLEEGGEKRLCGNRTAQKMIAAFGDRWFQFSQAQQDSIVEQWRTIESRESLIKWGTQKCGLSPDKAAILADAPSEDGYCNLSRKALSRLLPLMRQGESFKTAESRLYPNRFSGGQEHALLPPVRSELKELRNPAVERSLSELRKLVNALVRVYGKPYEIRIELARDLKKPRKARKQDWEANRKRQTERERMAKRLLEECGLPAPSRDDIEKALLWEECRGICPYTGKSIDFRGLFSTGEFQVEHILPLSRFPDNSFANKTLCCHAANDSKRNRTPFEAYGCDEEQWPKILERVRKFGNRSKLARFEITSQEELDEFTARQLNDTRYASKLAARYIGLLYGGRDVNGSEVFIGGPERPRRVIFASSGTVTATVRRQWGLEAILREPQGSSNGQNRGKPRTDHRHHAVDAIAIALTSEATVRQLSAAAAAAPAGSIGTREFRFAPAPWPDFVDSVRPYVERMVVSHRPEHKLSGALHEETLYSPPYVSGKARVAHVRKPLSQISAAEIEKIVDPAVRDAVKRRFDELGRDIKKLQACAEPPYLPSRAGRNIPIQRVRIAKPCSPVPIGAGVTERHVLAGNNHHVEIFAELDRRGHEVKWHGVVVSLLEAVERRRNKQPVVRRSYPDQDNYSFKFSLQCGDLLEAEQNGRATLYVVRSISESASGAVELALAEHVDARKINEMKAAQSLWRPKIDPMRKAQCRKVAVDILGNIHPAND